MAQQKFIFDGGALLVSIAGIGMIFLAGGNVQQMLVGMGVASVGAILYNGLPSFGRLESVLVKTPISHTIIGVSAAAVLWNLQTAEQFTITFVGWVMGIFFFSTLVKGLVDNALQN